MVEHWWNIGGILVKQIMVELIRPVQRMKWTSQLATCHIKFKHWWNIDGTLVGQILVKQILVKQILVKLATLVTSNIMSAVDMCHLDHSFGTPHDTRAETSS